MRVSRWLKEKKSYVGTLNKKRRKKKVQMILVKQEDHRKRLSLQGKSHHILFGTRIKKLHVGRGRTMSGGTPSMRKKI